MKSFLFVKSGSHLLAQDTTDTVDDLMDDVELNELKRHESAYSAATQVGSANSTDNIFLVNVDEGREDDRNFMVASFSGYLEFEVNTKLIVMDYYISDVSNFIIKQLAPVKLEEAA